MLSCTACFHRHVRLIFTNVLNTQPPLKRPYALPTNQPRSSYNAHDRNRTYGTGARHALHNDRGHSIARSGPPKVPEATLQAGDVKSIQPKEGEEFSKFALQKELSFVQDPLKLAAKIQTLLQKDAEQDVRKALALVRHASKDMPCTVSWNHIINHYMYHGNVSTAVKSYNEVWLFDLLHRKTPD